MYRDMLIMTVVIPALNPAVKNYVHSQRFVTETNINAKCYVRIVHCVDSN